MEPVPLAGYGLDAGVGLPDEAGYFNEKFTFTKGSNLNIPSSQAKLGIGFYFTGYQAGEYFYQDGALNLTGVKVTLNGTPVAESSTILILSAGLVGLAGFRRKFNKR